MRSDDAVHLGDEASWVVRIQKLDPVCFQCPSEDNSANGCSVAEMDEVVGSILRRRFPPEKGVVINLTWGVEDVAHRSPCSDSDFISEKLRTEVVGHAVTLVCGNLSLQRRWVRVSPRRPERQAVQHAAGKRRVGRYSHVDAVVLECVDASCGDRGRTVDHRAAKFR